MKFTILLALLFLALYRASPSTRSILFRVSNLPSSHLVIVRPYVAPFLGLRFDGDGLKVGDILACSQTQMSKQFGDHEDNFVTFECKRGDSSKGDKITLTLDGLRFADE